MADGFWCVGLDVSRDRMGWGLVGLADGSPVACGVENLRPRRGPGEVPADGFDNERPVLVRAALNRVRLQLPGGSVFGSRVGLVALEAPFLGRVNVTTVEGIMAVGSAWQAVLEVWPDTPCVWVRPAEWRRICGVEALPRGCKGAPARTVVSGRLVDAGLVDLAGELAGLRLSGLKPECMGRALEVGFRPGGSQDAADAGLVAMAAALRNAGMVVA